MRDTARPRDAIRLLVEMLRFHEGQTVSVEQLARETGLEWGEVYNYVLLIDDVLALAPELERTDDGVAVTGPSRCETPQLFEREDLRVLAYLFARTKTVEPIDMTDHQPFFERVESGVATAVENGHVEWASEDELALTPAGIGEIGPLYSRLVNGRSHVTP